MSKSLWGMYDGEPFMENPQLGILGSLNPHKRGKKKMAVRRTRRVHRRGRKSSAQRRRRSIGYTVGSKPIRRRKMNSRRRNWLVSGAVVPPNPRRRRRSSRRRHANPRRRTHARRNPAVFGLAFPSIKSIAFAGIGFAGPSFVSGFLTTTFPSIMQTTTNMGIAGKYIVRIGSVLGLAWLTKRFVGANEANMVLIGGATNVALTAVNDFVPGILPTNPLSMYVPTYPAPGTLQKYVPLRGLRAVSNPIAGQGMMQVASRYQRM